MMAITTTIPGRIRLATGTRVFKIETVSRGSTGGIALVEGPNVSNMTDCATSSTPSDATSFDSGEVLLSGLKARTSIATPTIADRTNAKAPAIGVANVGPNSPVFAAQKV